MNSRRRRGWFKSSLSLANGDCVQIRFWRRKVRMRDSKEPSVALRPFSGPAWDAFTAAAKAGEFNQDKLT